MIYSIVLHLLSTFIIGSEISNFIPIYNSHFRPEKTVKLTGHLLLKGFDDT